LEEIGDRRLEIEKIPLVRYWRLEISNLHQDFEIVGGDWRLRSEIGD